MKPAFFLIPPARILHRGLLAGAALAAATVPAHAHKVSITCIQVAERDQCMVFQMRAFHEGYRVQPRWIWSLKAAPADGVGRPLGSITQDGLFTSPRPPYVPVRYVTVVATAQGRPAWTGSCTLSFVPPETFPELETVKELSQEAKAGPSGAAGRNADLAMQTLFRKKFLDNALALEDARAWLLQAGEGEARAKAGAGLEALEKEQRKLVQLLESLANKLAPETNHPEGQRASRRSHPFMTWTAAQVPGQVHRFRLRSGALPRKLTQSGKGTLWSLDSASGWALALGPDGVLNGTQVEDKATIHDLAPGPEGVFLLASTAGGLQVANALDQRDHSDAALLTVLPAGLEGVPVGFYPGKCLDSDRPQVEVLLARTLLMHPLGLYGFRGWSVHHQEKGPEWTPGTRLAKLPGGEIFYVDPSKGTFGCVSAFSSEERTFSLSEKFGKLGCTDLAWTPAAAGTGHLYLTSSASDTLHRVETPSLKLTSMRLKPGTAPAAIVAGPDGNLLFATADGFGRIAPDGAITRVPILARSLQPQDLHINLAAGKLFFTEKGRPCLSALALGAPGKLTARDALFGEQRGPSLLAEAKEAEAKEETKTPAAGSWAGAAGSPAEEETATVMEADEEAEEAGTWGEVPDQPEPDRETKRAPARRVRLTNRQIGAERVQHILDGHRHRDGQDLTRPELVRGQFRKEFCESERLLRQLLFTGANQANAEAHFEGSLDTVVEFLAGEAVGRVRPPGTTQWAETRRVRVVLAWDPVEQRNWLVTAYPVPE